jgi:ubiquinone/menaquinone biosynthesis C-methylase UbiE/protein-S-isoprenylcysteine O-methyltransferase Ste14
MLERLIDKLVGKSWVHRSRQEQLRLLLVDELFFLAVVPWPLLLPARWLVGASSAGWSAPLRIPLGLVSLLLGLSFSLWAIRTQWVAGQGTPSLNAPPTRLVTCGPYRLCRNPIQFGALCYLFGLGALCFSLATALLALLAGTLVAIAYIRLVEERELAIRFGDAYLAYRQCTPFLLPRARCRVRPPDSTPPADSPDALPTRGRVLVKAAAIYDAVQPLVTLGQEASLNRWVAEQIAVPAGARILDVGCGTGLLTAQIAARHPEVQVIGIDASRPMIAQATRKRETANCRFQQALGEELPFADAGFELVTSALFFHHVDRELKLRALEEIARVLKPGGVLLVADMDRPYTWLGWVMSWVAWKLFRQPEIKENMDGVLREEIVRAGFGDLREIGRFSGYIRVLHARRA